MHNLTVVGGRCAGAAAELLLARKGFKVLVVDKAKFPAEIQHGHFIHQEGPGLLQRLGLLDEVVRSGCSPVTNMTTDLWDIPLTGTSLVRDVVALGNASRSNVVMKKTFLLIHGSWHGGWAWEDVICRLSHMGHRAFAPTLVGHAPNATRLGITHADCVNSVVAYIQERELEDIILVGHSFGGTVVQKVAEQLPKRIARIVFLDALVLADNQCVFDALPANYAALFNGLAAASSDNTMLIPWEIWRDNFMQDAPVGQARSIWEQLSPEPNQVNLDRLDLKRFYSLMIPKSFIYCRQDNALPAGYFHPRMSSLLGTFKLVEMDGSHEVMFTRPDELAEKIIEASVEWTVRIADRSEEKRRLRRPEEPMK